MRWVTGSLGALAAMVATWAPATTRRTFGLLGAVLGLAMLAWITSRDHVAVTEAGFLLRGSALVGLVILATAIVIASVRATVGRSKP